MRRKIINRETDIRFGFILILILAVFLYFSLDIFAFSFAIFNFSDWKSMNYPFGFFDANLFNNTDKLFVYNNYLVKYVCFLFVFAFFNLLVFIYQYLTHGNKIINSDGANVLENVKDEYLIKTVSDIKDDFGVKRLMVYVNGNYTSQNAEVFGFPTNYKLRLDNGLKILLRKDKRLFEALITHEIAHIVNHDTINVRLILSLFKTLIVTTIIPWSILTIMFCLMYSYFLVFEHTNLVTFSAVYSVFKNFVWLCLINIIIGFFLLLSIYIAISGLIRLREHYADIFTSEHNYKDEILRILSRKVARKNFITLFSFHPNINERYNVLKDRSIIYVRSFAFVFIFSLLFGFLASIASEIRMYRYQFQSIITEAILSEKLEEYSNTILTYEEVERQLYEKTKALEESEKNQSNYIPENFLTTFLEYILVPLLLGLFISIVLNRNVFNYYSILERKMYIEKFPKDLVSTIIFFTIGFFLGFILIKFKDSAFSVLTMLKEIPLGLLGLVSISMLIWILIYNHYILSNNSNDKYIFFYSVFYWLCVLILISTYFDSVFYYQKLQKKGFEGILMFKNKNISINFIAQCMLTSQLLLYVCYILKQNKMEITI